MKNFIIYFIGAMLIVYLVVENQKLQNLSTVSVESQDREVQTVKKSATKATAEQIPVEKMPTAGISSSVTKATAPQAPAALAKGKVPMASVSVEEERSEVEREIAGESKIERDWERYEPKFGEEALSQGFIYEKLHETNPQAYQNYMDARSKAMQNLLPTLVGASVEEISRASEELSRVDAMVESLLSQSEIAELQERRAEEVQLLIDTLPN